MKRSTPIDHRVAERDQRVDRALRKPVDELLEKFDQLVGHASLIPMASSSRAYGATVSTNLKPAAADRENHGRLRRVAVVVERDLAGDAVVILGRGDGVAQFLRSVVPARLMASARIIALS